MRMICKENQSIFVSGLVVLFMGFLAYTILRPINNMYIFEDLKDFLYIENDLPYTGNIPSFIHVVSFSLITVSFLELKKLTIVFVCSSWVVINVFFEFLQGTNYLQGHHGNQNLLYAYYHNGTFDFVDVGFCVLGGICSFLVINLFVSQRRVF